MTRAKATKGWGHFCLSCEGHAETSAGCNYITGILYALAGYAKSRAAQGKAEIAELTIDEKTPRFTVNCMGDERMEAAFDAAVIGLKQLQMTDGREIALEEKIF